MPERVPLTADIHPWLYRLPTSIDWRFRRQSAVDSEVMQEAIRLKLQQILPITFLRPPERPLKEANSSEIERRCA